MASDGPSFCGSVFDAFSAAEPLILSLYTPLGYLTCLCTSTRVYNYPRERERAIRRQRASVSVGHSSCALCSVCCSRPSVGREARVDAVCVCVGGVMLAGLMHLFKTIFFQRHRARTTSSRLSNNKGRENDSSHISGNMGQR